MARNGAGVYSNPYPNFVNGTVISSDQADANNAAIGTALTQSIAVDGQTTITANLPMNSKKFTGLAVGTAATDSLTLGQAQAQAFAWGGTAGGGADAITISPTPAITAYAVGQKFFWIASGSANTGAATIAISGLTAIAMQDGGAALAAGVHAAGKVFMGVLNTTSTVQILEIKGNTEVLSSLTVNGASQFNGAIIQGVNGTGYDATFFGDTPGAYLMWDQSADKLLTAGGALVDIVKDKLMIGGTAVTTTAAELNFNDTATAGTVVASKTVVASADKDIASFRNITLTGELDAGSLDISGIADIAGTTTVVALTASGVVTANANIDLNGTELILDADADTSITADTDDTIDIRIAGADDFQFTANDFTALSGSVISTNTIAETTGASGVTIDGLLIKDSTAAFADGAVATPSITNTGDLNTGVYFPAADTVGVVTGGVEKFRFGSNPISGKNLIQNGAMTINQRGTQTGLGAANAYGLDRWQLVIANTAARITISQDTDTPAGYGFSQKIDCTTVDSSVATNDLMSVGCKIEGQTTGLQNLLWGTSDAKTVTLSFWAKTDRSGGGNMGVSIQSAGTDYYATSVAITSTWTKFTVVIPGSENTVPVNDNSQEHMVSFTLISGSMFIQTAETWTTSSAWAVSGQTNFMDNTGNNVWFTGVQIEAGDISTDFEQEDISTTLAKCQRYLEKTFEMSVAPAQNTGSTLGALGGVNTSSGSGVVGASWRFNTRKRTAPTITTYNPQAADAGWRDDGNSASISTLVNAIGESGCTVAMNSASANANTGYKIHALAVAEL
jgi:hypothetical protein